MAAYLGGGTGSGDTHVPQVMGNKQRSGKMAGKSGSMLPPSGGTPGRATKAAKSAGAAKTKGATGKGATAGKTGSRAVPAGKRVPATDRTGRAGNAKQGGSFPGNNT